MDKSSPVRRTIEWQTQAANLVLVENEVGVICIQDFHPQGSKRRVSSSTLFPDSSLPLASLRLVGAGNTSDKTAKCLIGSYASSALKYQAHVETSDQNAEMLDVHSYDDNKQIHVTIHLCVYRGTSVLRSYATVSNMSDKTVHVTQLSSLTIGGLTCSSEQWFSDYTLCTATNGWFREVQWRTHTLPDIGIDRNGICELPDGHSASQANFSLSNRGSFSTGSYLPMGILKNRQDDDTWIWQIEHNGSWRWEIGDYKDSIYLSAGGPTASDHAWTHTLLPGASFVSVPVALGRVNGGIDDAFATITSYRRAIRRRHPDNENLPIIFNDYMNCLMGDPDEDKIKALLEPVSRMGVEYFVIDAGWYSDDSNWWDDVGLWEPSTKRFPSGFKKLLATIRERGLVPGLWLEPEVVGVRSVVAKRLPKAAFFHERGQFVVERGRLQLDYRHPEVRTWMTTVIERLVEQYGAGYFKFDYNIEVLHGSDIEGPRSSTGAAHIEHQRAYLSWVRELLDRWPSLIIENCSSGAQRMDYAMLSVHALQSTSDQQDPLLYAAIAAAAPTAVVPEQSATWAYPQPQWSDELNVFTVMNSLLGRVQLSGRLDLLSQHQSNLIAQGMQVYKDIRHQLKTAHAIWPLGLGRWHDDWLCLGMVSGENVIYLSVWRRTGATSVDVPLKILSDSTSVSAQVLWPAQFETDLSWRAADACLRIVLPNVACARLLKVARVP